MRHGVTIVITQQELEQQAGRTFPITREVEVVLNVTFSDPVVTLSGGHASLQADFAGGVMRHDLLRGRIAVTAIPRYEPSSGELYLEHATLERIELLHGPNRLLERYQCGLSAALAAWLDSHPAYTLEYSTLETAAARAVVRSLAIVGDSIHIELGW